MLKLRLKRCGRTKKPFYRVVLMESKSKRDGYAIEELGFYDPGTKLLVLRKERICERLFEGAKPTPTVIKLLVTAEILLSSEKKDKISQSIIRTY